MNAFQSLNTVLLAEALVIVVLILSAIFWLSLKRKSRDRTAVGDLIQSIGLTTDQHSLELEQQLSGSSALEQEALDALLNSAKQNEKALYQHIIALYLKRDVRLLEQLSQKVHGLTSPYCSALSQLNGQGATSKAQQQQLESLQQELDQAIHDKRRLSRELRTVSNTLEEVSDEYAQMFGGSRGMDEINASKKRMLRILENTLKELGDDGSKELTADPLHDLPQ